MTDKIRTESDLIIYIDSARYLPDNVNLTQVQVVFVDKKGVQIDSELDYKAILDPDSDWFSPKFNLKIELDSSKYRFDDGIYMIISLHTLEMES